MTKDIGRVGAIGLGVESTRGTAVAPAYWIPVETLDFDDQVEYIKNNSAMGRIEENNDSDIAKLWAEGEYGGKIYLDSVGEELRLVFGQSPSSVQRAATGVYDHTFTLQNDNNHDSGTIGFKDGVQDVRFPLGMVDRWSLSAAEGDYVKRTIALMSKKSASASNTVSVSDEHEFISTHIAFKQAADQASLDAAGEITVTNFQFEIAKNAEALYALGDNEPNDIVNKQFAVTGSFELFFEDETQRDLVFGGTKKAMRIDMTDTAVDLGSGHDPQLRFDFYNVSLEEFDRAWDGNEILRQTVNFEALYSISDAAMINARLTNTETSY